MLLTFALFRATNPLPNQIKDNIFLAKDDFGVNITTRPVSSRPHRMHAFKLEKDSAFIKEGDWDLSKMVQKPAFVSNVVWSTTDLSHTVLYGLDIPRSALVSTFQLSTIDNFLYWRGEVELHVQVLGTPFHTGCLMATFLPLTGSALTSGDEIINNFAALSINPTAYLQPNASTSAVITVPFITPYEYLDMKQLNANRYESLGTLYLVVMNQLAAATGSTTSVEVSIFSKFINNQFKVPRFNPVPEGLFSNMIEGALGKSIGKIVQSIMPENIIADSVDSLVGLTGLDKPSTILVQEPLKPISTQYLNSNRGIEFIDKFELNPSNMQMVDQETFGSTLDDMLMHDLISRYTYLGSFQTTSSDLGGTILAAIPLNPCPVPITTTNATAVVNQVPLLQYLSYPFKYWKGGLKFKIQVVATSMVTAKIYASVNHGVYNNFTSTVSRQALTSQYGFTFEVNQGSNTFEFDIPYVSSFPQLTVPYLNQAEDDTSLGLLTFVVINPVTISSNSPDLVRFNVFMAGADDFQLSTVSGLPMVPLGIGGNPYPVPPPGSPSFQPQSLEPMEVVQDEIDKTHKAPIIAPNQTESIIPSKSEKPVDNLYDILRRYQMIGTFSSRVAVNTSTADSTIGFNIFDIYSMICPTSYIDAAADYRSSIIQYYGSMFRLFKGPLRFKVVTLKPFDGCIQVYYIPSSNNGQTWLPSEIRNYFIQSLSYNSSQSNFFFKNAPPQFLSQTANSFQNTLEFEVPFISNFKSVFLSSVITNPETIISPLGYFVVVSIPHVPTPTAYDIPFQIYMAFGDEARFGLPIAVPRVGPNIAIPTVNNASVGPTQFSNSITTEFTLTIL